MYLLSTLYFSEHGLTIIYDLVDEREEEGKDSMIEKEGGGTRCSAETNRGREMACTYAPTYEKGPASYAGCRW
jgi:hypothetical protein